MFSQYCRLNVHVLASNRELISKASRTILKAEYRFDREKRTARHAWYRRLMEHHESARNIVKEFRL